MYLDNAATTHKPRVVIDRMTRYYAEENASIHRGVHSLSGRATDAYETARARIRHFLNAAEAREIIFVRGTTDGTPLTSTRSIRSWAGNRRKPSLQAYAKL